MEINDNRKVQWRYTALPLGWAVVLLVGSLAPPSALPALSIDWGDKLEHTLAYALFAWLIARGIVLSRDGRGTKTRAMVIAVIIAAAWGAAMEGLQALTSYRDFDFLDGCCNLLGACLGAVAWQSSGNINALSLLNGIAPQETEQ